jgi:hypothetical protein
MAALDSQAWAAAYNSEYVGFKEREVFKVVKPEPGVKILDTLTRLEYKEDNGEFIKCKARLCARGDQQVDGVNYKETDLYAPTLKAAEGRLLMAIAAANGHKIYKTDTKQAYLYGEMGEDVVYLNPPFWWLDCRRNQFRKDTYSSSSRAYMVRSKRRENGISIFQIG